MNYHFLDFLLEVNQIFFYNYGHLIIMNDSVYRVSSLLTTSKARLFSLQECSYPFSNI